MNLFRRFLSFCALATLMGVPIPAQVPLATGVRIAHPDHHEFEAALWAPFLGEQGEARTFKVGFGFVDAETGTMGSWRLELVDAKGHVRRVWHGETFLSRGSGSEPIAWNGADTADHLLEQGFYTLRLTAKPLAQNAYRYSPGGNQADRVEAFLASSTEETATQETTICVGPAPRQKVRKLNLPVGPSGRFMALAQGSAPAPASLPYTIYIGNLHSQTNHSDGGVVPASCVGAEDPQAGTQGPTEAYDLMRNPPPPFVGGDFLATTEHNHMFDGSTGTNLSSDPADPTHNSGLFATGLLLASNYRSAHPGFVAVYGTEWGVISNGGHLNIFNADGLPTWERNASNQLLGDFYTPKSDYPSIYLTMQSRNWVGQFNHPQTSQFNGLTYTAAGDEVMALCEVSNSGAFSKNMNEGAAPDSDAFLSNYEIAYNAILERGFHVSPTSDQDNHCANWGLSQRNRTGILLPNGTPWTLTTLLDAIRARRTFATHDKGSQIVLTTSGGAMMGDRINNTGSLTLQVHFATTTPGQDLPARTQLFEGLPGTAFSTVQMIEGTDTATITPAAGNHYYYAKITQANGAFLWSAPIWVNQAAGAVAANITDPAVNTTVQDGTTVNFTGSATTTHTSIVSHGWDFGDGQIGTGATTSHLFTNPGPGNIVRTVTYTATDNLGFIGQASRLITVQPFGVTNTNPTISNIPNQSTLKNIPINNLGFTIGDAETNPNLLTVTATSSNQTLLSDVNITLGGSGSSRTISMAPAADQTGTSTVTVTVVDGAGATATDTFTFSVGAPGTGSAKLIISQYYEGTSNNKWIEITNVGGGAYDANDVNQTPLYLQTWSNPPAGTTYGSWLIDGTLAAGATRTYRNNSAVIPAAGNITGTPIAVTSGTVLGFNGNDATYITPLSTAGASAYAARTDAIGDTNNAPGGWANGGGLGVDKSFYRNAAVINPSAIYTPSEWTLALLATVGTASTGTTQRLGEHVFNSPASISDILSQTIEANQQAGPLAFTVGGTGTLTVTAVSDNALLLPNANIVLTGAGTETARTITATPVADQVGTALITVTVTDGVATTASDTFVLTVTEPNSTITGVSVSPVDPTVNGLSTTTFTATVTGTGSFSQAVNWSATGGSINALGQWTAPNTVGPFTLTATSVQNGLVSGTTLVTVTPVNTNPTISDITDQSATAGVLLGPIPFTVGDLESPVGSLTVSAVSNNLTLLPNASITFGGSGASRTISLTPTAGQFGTVTVTVTVNDGTGGTATDTFVVSVAPPPSKVIISQYYEGATGTNKWLEITNTAPIAVNLASPQLYVAAFQNANADNPAGSSPNGTFALTGTLNPGQSLVLRNSATALPAYALPGSVAASTVTQFNGDDLLILTLSNSGTAGTAWAGRVDLIGNGNTWGQDVSFHRKPAVMVGNRTFDLPGEWDQRTLAQADTALFTVSEYIGIHYFGTLPTISDMTDLTVTVNVPVSGIPFAVNDAETPLDNLVFTFASSNTTLLPNAGITVSGTGSSRILNLAPAANQLGTATVTVTIKDHGNLTASDTFVLTVNDVPPSNLTYSANPAVYVKDMVISPNVPSHAGGAIVNWSVSPALPEGLSMDVATGIITGTPTTAQPPTIYTITATNSGGSANVGLSIAVNLRTRNTLTYSVNPATYTKGIPILPNTPLNVGAGTTSFSVTPALPVGLSLNTSTGVITGTPTAVTSTATYVVGAHALGISMIANLVITVNDVAPAGLTYSQNLAVYTKGTPIAANLPASAGGPITAYSVFPALPVGLTLDGLTGVITGTPTVVSGPATYTVTGTNSGGSASVAISIRVLDIAPSGLAYAVNPAVYNTGAAILPNTPNNTGGTITGYTVSPALPLGLTLNPLTGVISGTPMGLSTVAVYAITGSNSGGSTSVSLSIQVIRIIISR